MAKINVGKPMDQWKTTVDDIRQWAQSEIDRLSEQLEKISKMPDVAEYAGVGDGSVVDAVAAVCGALTCARRDLANLHTDFTHDLGVENVKLRELILMSDPLAWAAWEKQAKERVPTPKRFPKDESVHFETDSTKGK